MPAYAVSQNPKPSLNQRRRNGPKVWTYFFTPFRFFVALPFAYSTTNGALRLRTDIRALGDLRLSIFIEYWRLELFWAT